jgi:hypothetical protein
MKEEMTDVTSKGREIFGEVWMACPRAIHLDFTPTYGFVIISAILSPMQPLHRLPGIALVSHRVINQYYQPYGFVAIDHGN